MRYLVFYTATLLACLAIDSVWLSLMNARLYRPVLGDILLDQPRIGAIFVFYLSYIGGTTFFAGKPALQAASWKVAALYGGLFGLCCYATYDLTNQATLRNWSTLITVADITWGIFLTGASASFGYAVTKYLKIK